ncbi:MAG TPA: hypothetical protein VK892_02210 [Pyrinomonadaceae bacterium]|nr:hypothetical protein [Pyrinomonadaceae bacterium]
MKHIEFEKLVNNFENRLSLAEREEVSEHLRVCAECAASAAKLEDFFSYVQADKDAQVSQADTARLLNIFKPGKTVSAERESFGKRLLASLVFDDWRTAVQERFAATDSRNLLYRAGRFEIDLRLQFTGDKCQVSGQIFPDCSQPTAAEIFSEETSEKAFLNNYCEFVFPPLKAGIYNFRINSDGEIIEIENLPLFN